MFTSKTNKRKRKGLEMSNKEAKTNLWVYDLLKQADIFLEPQGSSIKEIQSALKTASKRKTGKIGRAHV